ncbi:hypothetical protein [Lentibacillus sediminis]|uniref:hypothetical protein n=1 Tax=Lentibacillus sediminis TaxID=1940529 RepID=UPI00117B5A46|nr:hypothetical protein [Lentibacillus sediminis]
MRSGSALPLEAAVLADHSFGGDKGNTPLHRGVPTLAREARFSRPSLNFAPMLTYRTEVREVNTALALELAVAYPRYGYPQYAVIYNFLSERETSASEMRSFLLVIVICHRND